MTILELNALEAAAFVTQLEAIFEQSPWVAERVVNERPFESRANLHVAMCAAMRSAPLEQQLELIRAHPELAARATMTPDSVSEQRGAGLDRLTPNEHAALLRLNRAYRERFGFPFILAVKGKDKNDIRAAFEERVKNDLETEFQTALSEIEKIAGFRLEALIEN